MGGKELSVFCRRKAHRALRSHTVLQVSANPCSIYAMVKVCSSKQIKGFMQTNRHNSCMVDRRRSFTTHKLVICVREYIFCCIFVYIKHYIRKYYHGF